MERKRNWFLWIGLVLAIAGFVLAPFLMGPPALRDIFPWANLAVLGLGTALIIAGIVRAFGKREIYRGRILGPIFGVVGCLAIAFFCFVGFYIGRQIPASAGAPQVGQKVPDFSLPDQEGKQTTLADLLRDRRALLLIFYRGHW